MSRINVVLECSIKHSFVVDQVAGIFDVPLAEKSRFSLSVEVPLPGDTHWGDWKIGAIVGPSGSGKSCVAEKAFGNSFVRSHHWPVDRAIIDVLSDEQSDFRTITDMLNAVGLSSPPAWVRPYYALSNGQRFRADLARAMLVKRPVLAYDEFTSVVDRQVGKFASASIAKVVRANRSGCERFVAVTCHYDILDWLEPDWVLDLATRELTRGFLRRPPIELEIREGGKAYWPMFAPHHYLSSNINRAAKCYLCLWNEEPIGFCATLINAGFRGYRRVHRLVVLPDYQGMGIGLRLLETVVELEHAAGKRMSICTSHPALIPALRRRRGWRLNGIKRCTKRHNGALRRCGIPGSIGRVIASFRWVGHGPQVEPHVVGRCRRCQAAGQGW